ncbi:MAG TPA: hypothetical protein VFN13_10710, partial [Rudaea sp.]|nr:hypothetical protein [Rudaea sp.]
MSLRWCHLRKLVLQFFALFRRKAMKALERAPDSLLLLRWQLPKLLITLTQAGTLFGRHAVPLREALLQFFALVVGKR